MSSVKITIVENLQSLTVNIDDTVTSNNVEILDNDSIKINVTEIPEEVVVVQSQSSTDCDDSIVKNSDGTYVKEVKSGDTLFLADINVTDSDGSTSTVPAMTDVVCTPAITPTGIAYQQIPFSGQTTSRRTYDEAWQFSNSLFDRTPPVNPEYVAELDYTDASPFYTLKNNNAFGNTNRFTDENGLQVFGNNYAIDHLTGIGLYTIEMTADLWDNVVTEARGLSVLGYTDFNLSSVAIVQSIRDYQDTGNYTDLPTFFTSTTATWTATSRPASTNFISVFSVGRLDQQSPTTQSYTGIAWRKHY